MRNILCCFVIVLMSFSVMADHHDVEKGVKKGDKNAALYAAIKAFDHAYANNDVEDYFSFYADDVTAYFGDGRVDIAAYHKMWIDLMAAGGGVELNEMSDLQVQLCQAVMSLSQGPSSTPAHACQLEQRVRREYSRQT